MIVRDGQVLLIIPAFDEARRLPGVLDQIRSLELDLRVLVIDDGSRDDTSAAASRGGAAVVRHPFNLGYGAALQSGYKYAIATDVDYVLQMDADGQHPVSELGALLEAVRGGDCDLAIGSRFLRPGEYRMGLLRSLGRRVFRGVARLGGLEITDPTSGLQAMNRRVLELFVSDWYPHDFPDVDVLLLVHRKGLRIRELPVEMAESARPSTLHSGWAPLYYGYRMLLALWALGAVSREPRE